MITLQNITLRYGKHILFHKLDWTIYPRQRIGIIGTNGSGKTSLFSLLLGKIEADQGSLDLPRQLKLSHVAQETLAYSKSALEYVLEGDTERQTLQTELALIEQTDDGHRIAFLHARLGEIDAYTAPARAAQLLNGLGFNHLEQKKAVSDFSGGWRMRLNLAQALMCRSDVLLLDEPTNHLDLDAVMWLENWLMHYPGTLLLISHDRDFLDHTVDHIAHLSHQQLKLYTGNYSSFEKQLAADILVQQATYEKQQKKMAHLQSFISRFRAKASKARQAQSRIKALEKMETVSAIQLNSPFQFHFKEPTECPHPLIRLEDVNITYGPKTVLSEVNLGIAPQDRIALIGPNGAGKSTLIKLLAGDITLTQGRRDTGGGLKIGYFAQHQIDHLVLTETPLDHLRKIAERSTEKELRTFLGSFGFSENRVFETVKSFSGGEKSRLALALIVWQQPNLLLLDEPTNHLDLDMRYALSMALQEYQGAVILVSHDRFLVRTTVDQLLLVAEGKLTVFTGDLNDYERWLIHYRKQNESQEKMQAIKAASHKSQRQEDAKRRELRKPLVHNVKKLADELAMLEKKLVMIETQLADTELYEEKNKSKLQELLIHQAQIQQKLKETEENWLKACEILELPHD
ncbi:MAG: yheS 2 [Gammaproteobacteria bacterium]|jgi:ATP-binding cassette subfamily F protein 3|nr:yheS 2 [Gammaproteobacteria bacterium]